ncbi:MAG TPA: dipeptidase PepV [Bacillota bacterium]|nr:dipeptidase PepV [Bacillota bacterium]
MNLSEYIDDHKDEIIKSVQELIRIKSVKDVSLPGKPFGDEINKCLEYALSLSESMGFTVKNIDGYAGYAEFGQGDETMGILVHLDVVPEGSHWTYPPFEARIVDNKIYGRGAIDDKGPAIGALYAMKAVMDSGIKMNKKVRMIFGTDEESGWQDLEVYFDKEPMPDFGIIPDGEYPVINVEKGIITLVLKKQFEPGQCSGLRIKSIDGGHRPNMVPDQCSCCFYPTDDQDKILAHLHSMKQFSDYDISAGFCEDKGIEITAKGISAHGSTPERGKNAASHILAFLSTMGLGNSDLEQFILFLNNTIGSDTRGKGLNLELEDEQSGQLTLNLGKLSINEELGEAVINIRFPVTHKKEDIIKRVEDSVKDAGVMVEVLEYNAPLYVPEDSELVTRLKKVYTEQTGQPAKALAIGGGTYARAIKNAVAFGAQFPGTPDLAHQKDEYIGIDDLVMHAKIYAHAIKELCGQ